MTRTFVVTCRVPVSDLDELDLRSHDHMVSVTGPDGYQHKPELPDEADLDRLDVVVRPVERPLEVVA